MILYTLIFTLGFLVAGLLALACLPAVWSRALRLTEERLSRLVPLSAEEIAAERDHLRAGHAVELRRIEQRLERAEAAAAALKVDAARREGRILALEDEGAHAQVTVATLEAERAALRREVDELWAASGAEAIALHGLSDLAERRLADIAALQAERDGLAQDVDRNRSSVAGLETRLVGADARIEDLGRELAQAQAALTRRDGADRLQDERAQDVEALKVELAFMAEQAASAERRATETSKAYAALAAARASEAAPPSAPDGAGDARLRAAIAALADDILRSTQP